MSLTTTTDTDGRVRGELVQVCIDGVMSVFQSRMREMLDDEGIERPDPSPDEWYSLEKFLHVLAAVEQNAGENALRKVGESTPRFVDWPGGVEDAHGALAHLGDLYADEHRNAAGGYEYERLDDGQALVASTTPYPTQWEDGLLKGTVHHFSDDHARVVVEEDGDRTEFEVHW